MSVKITDNSELFKKNMGEQLKRALTECGMEATGYAQDLCPVDTGNLRNSITHTVKDNDCYVGTNVEYAAYVELGTGSHYHGGSGIAGMRAQAYLKPAVADHKEDYKSIIEDNLKR